MIKKEGKIPVNARVNVDYSGKKPKIDFKYTSKNPKKDAHKQCLFGKHTLVLMIFLTFILIGVIYSNREWVDYPSDCNMTFDENNGNGSYSYRYEIDGEIIENSTSWNWNHIKGFNITCDNETYYYWYNRQKVTMMGEYPHFYRGILNKGYWIREVIPAFLTYTIFLSILYLLNYILTKWLIKQRWYQKWLPINMAGGKGRKKKYYKFKPKDVDENIIIVPMFKNIELDYKTSGDFNKYLRRIKISEHRHYEYKKGKVGKLKVEVFKWYAIFYFKEKPESGFLEVIYQ